MQTILNSSFLVFLGEMGDKTQLLSLLLIGRFRRPWIILLGILIATLLNHFLASWVGILVSSWIPAQYLAPALAIFFFVFALWVLVPDKEGEIKTSSFGVLMATVIAFFIAEMGDKTQIVTVALAAKYSDIVLVTAGTTIGMLSANIPVVFLGEAFLKRVPLKWVRISASILFVAFGIMILVGY